MCPGSGKILLKDFKSESPLLLGSVVYKLSAGFPAESPKIAMCFPLALWDGTHSLFHSNGYKKCQVSKKTNTVCIR